MLSSTINKFINSSLSLAFLTITAFSTAYCYGWGQALFHGYPWWHVEIGNASMARSLAYVFTTSVGLLALYCLGYCFINKILQMRWFAQIGWLRVLVLVSVFFVPIMLTFYVFIGKIPFYLSSAYVVLASVCIALFQRKWNHTSLPLDFRKMLREERFWFFNLFIFVYFSLLALSIGYLRSELRQTYDYMQINGKNYYILSTNSDKGYIMGEKLRDNEKFLFFNRENKEHYQIHVIKVDI